MLGKGASTNCEKKERKTIKRKDSSRPLKLEKMFCFIQPLTASRELPEPNYTLQVQAHSLSFNTGPLIIFFGGDLGGL